MDLNKRILEPSLMEDDEFLEYYEYNRHIGLDKQDGVAKAVAKLCKNFNSGKVLDIGCGIANVPIYLAQQFESSFIVGIDASEKAIEFGKGLVKEHYMNDRIVLSKAHLPYENFWHKKKDFNLVFSRSALHHFANPLDFWYTVKDNLKEDGSVFVLDLIRPETSERAARLVYDRFKGEVNKPIARAFYNSLCAAHRAKEVKEHLEIVSLLPMKILVNSEIHIIIYR